MKKVCCFLLLLFIGITSFAQKTEKLPKVPWEDIILMNTYEGYLINNQKVSPQYSNDLTIKLEGNYSEKDSLAVSQIITKLDSLTETISIKFSKNKKANLKVFFLDTIVRHNQFNTIISSESSYDNNKRTLYNLYIYNRDRKKTQNFDFDIQANIAKNLVSGNFPYSRRLQKPYRNSIFSPYSDVDLNNAYISPLNNEDMLLIKEVYRVGYKERLKIAEKQFQYIYENSKQEKIQTRNRSIWWVKNPNAVLVLPTIILLLIFVFFINKIYQVLSRKIKNNLFRFGSITLIAMVFAYLLIVLYVSFNDFLTIPDDYHNVPIIRNDTLLTTALLLVVVIPFIFLFRFIELKISKSSQNNIIKTLLIFVSTWLIPFMVLWLFAFLSNEYSSKDLTNQNYAFLSRAFVILIAIASIRALISFFFFKERNLIIENENKLSALRELKTKAELKSLQSQINPHFLYNALNSIASLAPVDTVKTQKMAYSLSDLFKYTINRKGKKMSTVSDEVIMVENYLEIEKIRFGDRLQFTIDIDKALEKVKIPLFIIQPLVENAVKHGISKIEGEGKIELKINKTAKGILIVVKDNGPNFPEGLVSGHGLQTVFDLLRLTYGDSATLNWQNTPEKSITVNIAQNI